MNKDVDGGSAFPSHGSMGEVEHRGMSLRDWFAGRVMSAFDVGMSHVTPADLAAHAYTIADAMLKQRSIENGER